jgi:hypothetical protein
MSMNEFISHNEQIMIMIHGQACSILHHSDPAVTLLLGCINMLTHDLQ